MKTMLNTMVTIIAWCVMFYVEQDHSQKILDVIFNKNDDFFLSIFEMKKFTTCGCNYQVIWRNMWKTRCVIDVSKVWIFFTPSQGFIISIENLFTKWSEISKKRKKKKKNTKKDKKKITKNRKQEHKTTKI